MHYNSQLTELESYNIKEGMRVKALYLGEYPIQGEVVTKRTKYGWKVQYGIKIEQELVLPFRKDTYKEGLVIGVDNDNILYIIN